MRAPRARRAQHSQTPYGQRQTVCGRGWTRQVWSQDPDGTGWNTRCDRLDRCVRGIVRKGTDDPTPCTTGGWTDQALVASSRRDHLAGCHSAVSLGCVHCARRAPRRKCCKDSRKPAQTEETAVRMAKWLCQPAHGPFGTGIIRVQLWVTDLRC